MSLALQNPRDRRRLNKLRRGVVKGLFTPAEAVSLWLSESKKPASQRDERLRRHFAVGIRGTGVRVRDLAAKLPKLSKKEAKARKAELEAAGRAIAREFSIQDPEGYKPSRGKRGRMVSYAGRAASGRGKGHRYSVKGRPTNTKRGRKSQVVPMKIFGRMIDSRVRNVPVIVDWDQTRKSNRAAGRPGKVQFKRVAPKVEGKAKTKSKRKSSGSRKAKKGAVRYRVPRGQGGMLMTEWEKEYQRAEGPIKGKRLGKKRLQLMRDAALMNPRRGYGDLALTNPSIHGMGRYLVGYALPVTLAGAAAGGVHALAATTGVTEKISEYVSMIPVVGAPVATHAPFTLQGLIVGSALALLAPFAGRTAGKYLALTGGAALVGGGVIDAFNWASGMSADADVDVDLDAALASDDLAGLALGDLALTNGAFGDLAMTNGSLGDGFAYEVAPLTMSPDGSADYGQSALGDAMSCGADFSPVEGQALLNGRASWLRRFGGPPHRLGGASSASSHLAGREGHRWGWLIRLIGWDRAQRIAALPPEARVRVIRKLRQTAVASFREAMVLEKADRLADQSSDSAVLPSAGFAAPGATGAGDSVNYLGDPALFMGA